MFSVVYPGGLSCFRQNHQNLCDHSLHLHESLDAGIGVSGASGHTGALPHSMSLPSTPDIEDAELTPILPFLYLGNEHDAQDAHRLQRYNIGFVLNVTTHLPLYHYDTGLFSYKRLPATDSNKQNLRQYFEEAFEFIGTQEKLAKSSHCMVVCTVEVYTGGQGQRLQSVAAVGSHFSLNRFCFIMFFQATLGLELAGDLAWLIHIQMACFYRSEAV